MTLEVSLNKMGNGWRALSRRVMQLNLHFKQITLDAYEEQT